VRLPLRFSHAILTPVNFIQTNGNNP